MDLDLTHQFLLRARLGECSLVDNFCGANPLVFEVGEFVAPRKATLAEESASRVAFDADVAVETDDLLFNDDV
jgi:hypothetical protein